MHPPKVTVDNAVQNIETMWNRKNLRDTEVLNMSDTKK